LLQRLLPAAVHGKTLINQLLPGTDRRMAD
jgi:hypothetical protein